MNKAEYTARINHINFFTKALVKHDSFYVKSVTHEDIERQTEEFLSRGGKIREIEAHESGTDGTQVCNYMVI